MTQRLNMDLLLDRAYLAGEWTGSANTFSVTDPATGAGIVEVPDLTPQTAKLAVDGSGAGVAGMASQDRKGTRRRFAPLV